VEKFSDITGDGLIEGLGKELEPTQSQGPTLIQPVSGHWIFQFNYAKPSRVTILVNILFAPPFSSVVELRAEMNEPQIKTLRNWLDRILETMNEEPEDSKNHFRR
jgi:hypothetical protein